MTMVRCAVAGISSYHVNLIKNILRSLNNVKLIKTDWLFRHVDILYCIFGLPPSLLANPLFWMRDKPLLIIHWIGSDVLYLVSPSSMKTKIYRQLVKLATKLKKRIINLAGSPWLVDELKTQGIRAIYLPLSTLNIERMKPPNIDVSDKDIDVLSYVPKRRFTFYGGHHILKLARNFPEYTFVVVMPDVRDDHRLPRSPFKNLVFMSKRSFEEMQALYLRAKCFLRLTKHDGLSLSILEALYYKLTVVWTYRFPYAIHVNYNDVEKLKTLLPELIDNYSPNEEGHQFVVTHFSQDALRKRLQKLLEGILRLA